MSGAGHRAGQVAIVGRPNVGKSTLLNSLVGQKISITSRKPQTTRSRVTGILTRDDAQLVFVDTPGFQTRHLSALNRLLNRSVASSLLEVGVVIWVIEALKFDARDAGLGRLLPADTPVVLVPNKIDRVRDKRDLLPFIKDLSERVRCSAVVPVSAQKKQNLGDLVDTVAALLPEGPPIHANDEITTLSERFFAAELVREQLFRLLGEELPYSTAVEIERFELDGSLRRIYAAVLVDRDSQKPIIIGRKGEKLKKIGTAARGQMEQLFGGKVFLEVWVKVKSGWAESDAVLKQLGYDA
jgi:GTPase